MKLSRCVAYYVPCVVLLCCVGCNKARHKRSAESAPGITTRRHTEDPQKPTKVIKQMTIEEALAAARYYEFIDHEALLLATYQHIVAKSKDADITASYLLKLADHYLKANDFAEAKRYYKKVTTLYPGHPDIERARYREVLAHYLSSLAPSRDQAATQTTITLAKSYLADFPQGATSSVMSLLSAAYKKLLVSELLVVDFYLNKFYLTGSAQSLRGGLQRLQSIVDIILTAFKKYDTQVSRMLASESWREQVDRNWKLLDTDLMETDEGRQQVARRIQEALRLLQTVTVPHVEIPQDSMTHPAQHLF